MIKHRFTIWNIRFFSHGRDTITCPDFFLELTKSTSIIFLFYHHHFSFSHAPLNNCYDSNRNKFCGVSANSICGWTFSDWSTFRHPRSIYAAIVHTNFCFIIEDKRNYIKPSKFILLCHSFANGRYCCISSLSKSFDGTFMYAFFIHIHSSFWFKCVS